MKHQLTKFHKSLFSFRPTLLLDLLLRFKNLARTIASVPINFKMLMDTQEWYLLCVATRKDCTQILAT